MHPTNRPHSTIAAIAVAALLAGCLDAPKDGSGGTSNGASASIPLTLPSGQTVSANRDVANSANSLVLAQELAVCGGKPGSAYSWQFTQAPFSGPTIDTASGTIGGQLPAGTGAGSYFFSVSVSDGNSPAVTGYFTLNVVSCDSSATRPSGFPTCPTRALASGNGTASPISINSEVGLSQVPTQASFGYSLRGSGGTPPYKTWTWTAVTPVNTLPPGLALDAPSGVIWGTPLSTASGTTYTFDVTVSDSVSATSPASRYTIAF